MAFILRVSPRLTQAEIEQRFRKCRDVGEKLRWQAVMLKGEGRSAREIASICKRREDWVRRTVRRFNEEGPEGLLDGRVANGRARLLTPEQEGLLCVAIDGPAPGGGVWTSGRVAEWCATSLGVPISEDTAWKYLRRLGFSRQVPRPKHPDADERAQDAFKKGGFPVVFETSFENIRTPKSRSGRRTKPGTG